MTTELPKPADRMSEVLGEIVAYCREAGHDWSNLDEAEALLAAGVGAEPSAWMAEYIDPLGNDHVYVTSHHDLAVENDMHGDPKPLWQYRFEQQRKYADMAARHPQVPHGAEAPEVTHD